MKNQVFLFGALIIGVFLMSKTLLSGTKGYRNNNAGNIRYNSANDWMGQVGDDGAGFVVFSDPVYGYRALAKLLTNYYAKGLQTIRQIINRYAPPVENNTGAYVDSVAAYLGRNPDEVLFLDRDLLPLMQAISKHENGRIAYSDELVAQGIALA